MGYDEENLEPLPRRNNKKDDGSELNLSFLIITEFGKRQISASCVNELRKSIKENVNFDSENEELSIEYWSDIFNDWVLLDNHLPKNNSKIQVSTKPKDKVKSCHPKNSNPNLFDNEDFIENLNLAFKAYLQTDTEHKLENFETAVIFLLRRAKDKISFNDGKESLAQIIQEHNTTLINLNDELKKLKTTLKQFKTDIECLKIMNSKNTILSDTPIKSKKSSLFNSAFKAITNRKHNKKLSSAII
ncbi:unnamed protein product [Brachionus calyciflorus]|uniref:Uncharacterized protein n=1 Tax=Brachionus calyciflorus TaxID=104777 RepID=A0A814EWD9_9BILA|nr:unnamed protein product [Brachionus calyciflorus]